MSAPLPAGDAAIDDAAVALARHVAETLPATRPHERDALAALPAALARPLLARLDARVDRDAPAPESDWVDADRARDAARAWREAARDAARVPAPAWAGFLADTCRLVVSHLVRPAETLAAVAFEDEWTEARPDAEVPTAVALRRLRAFAPYPYLPEVAARYVERKSLARIDRAELEGLLRRIDRRMVASFSADEWAALLDPLLSLLGPLSPAGDVPTGLLEAFFEAKGRADLADALTGEPSYTASSLRSRLARALPLPETAAPPAQNPHDADSAAEADETAVEQTPSSEAREVVAAEPPPIEPPAAPEPVLEPFQIDDERLDAAPAPVSARDVPEVPETGASTSSWLAEAALMPAETSAPDAHEAFAPPAPEAPAPPAPVREEPDEPDEAQPLWKRMMTTAVADGTSPAQAPLPEPLWKQFVSHPDSEDSAPRPPASSPQPNQPPDHAAHPHEDPALAAQDDLTRLESRALSGTIDVERRAWFVAELFSGSEADYRTALAALAAAPSWADATAVLSREMFLKHRVNAYSEAATALMDAAEERFRP